MIKLIASLMIAAATVAVLAIPAAARAQNRRCVLPGAERVDAWEPLLRGKRVALLANHTAVIDSVTHTLDALLDAKIDVRLVLSPEHGFRGTADAGRRVDNSVDERTGLPILSLYGRDRAANLRRAVSETDVVVVDMQDVGARFYTYHITMIQAMEEAARQGKAVVVFDRPNPLGMIVDGPMLDDSQRSGVGRIPVPMVHGLTMGEIAVMANGESWLSGGRECDLTVVTCDNYNHSVRYKLPVGPSPNLPNMQAVYLYPSLCLFEGTPISMGRGTEFPFQVYGHPGMQGPYIFEFTPRDRPGASNPVLKGQTCRGMDLRGIPHDTIVAQCINLEYILDAYRSMGSPREGFFTPMFDKLAGTTELRRQIEQGLEADSIKASWRPALDAYKALRRKYLLYPEE